MSTRATGILSRESTGVSDCIDRLASLGNQERPASTYRFQFHANFRFTDAIALVPYLHALGITHCYASPILKARAGSMHGYDITNHNELNPELGTEDEFRRLAAELKSRGMGLILDTVPNHMGVGYGDNPWWQDVLENGRSSQYAAFFDIDWEPVKTELRDKVLIPVLGNQYGEELESGKIRLGYEEGRFFLQYYGQRLPIDPQTFAMIFEPIGDLRAQELKLGVAEGDGSELENILWDLRQLPPHSAPAPESAAVLRKQIPELQERLRVLVERSPQVRSLIDLALDLCNGSPGNPRSFDALHRLLEAQAYRLAYWRVSAQEINYRRFFDINDLVGLRMENEQVFAATHHMLRRFLAEGLLSGLRLDHPDGLLNPVQYFTRLQMLYAASQCCGPYAVPPVAENGIEVEIQDGFGRHDWTQDPPLYLVVEKILERGEELPRNWLVHGTVGYDFTNLVNGIFIDGGNERFFTHLYRRFVGGDVDFDLMAYEARVLIMRTSLSSEVTVLSHILEEIASRDRHARDFTRPALTDAIRGAIASFPVYRTYIDERGTVSERDRDYIVQAIARAKRRDQGMTPAVYDFLRDILLLTGAGNLGDEAYRKRLHFTLKFQQLTGPVMAKGLEDTVCYVYNRFVSVNEVGGWPAEFGVSTDEFHRGNMERADRWDLSMLTTSTHDTKRSEDVRARLDVLSEMPRVWSANVMRWRRSNRFRKKTISDGRVVPDANEEYLLYQTLVGTWPLEMSTSADREQYVQRIKAYMVKAIHEAKVNLSWVNQNPEYVQGVEQFIERTLRHGGAVRPNLFLQQIESFVPIVSFFGTMNSLSQLLLKITSPGVADCYQGTELWDFSLVDPDNRRPVDFDLRRRLLEDLLTKQDDQGSLTELCTELIRHYDDGRIKMWTTLRALKFRREHADLFRSGQYVPLHATGTAQQHVVAFARENESESAVVVAPRLSYTIMKGQMGAPLGEVWGDTELSVTRAGSEYVDAFGGHRLRSSGDRTLLCREVFAHFPVALLEAR